MTCLSFCCVRRSEPTQNEDELYYELARIHNVHLYSYKELRTATDDFRSSNKLGEGGFGPVYLGRLKNGQLAAIKILSSDSRQGVKEFLTEVQVISDIDNENLVKLYGCCVEGIHRILVYNYLENNSLARTLLSQSQSSINFSWEIRVKICIGVAKGLAYLHEEVRPCIIHRDIKASNILLDEDLNPKISDFGLAKLLPASMTHVSTRVAGTLGYLAPEYAIRGQVTKRADVYSFGVLILEVISGRCNTNRRLPPPEQFLLERTWKCHERNELITLVDTSLNGDFDAEQACRILKIGLLCTQEAPRLRPSMSNVVQMLTGEKDIDGIFMTRPGLVSDLKNMTIPTGISSGADDSDRANSSSGPSTQSTWSNPPVYDRSCL